MNKTAGFLNILMLLLIFFTASCCFNHTDETVPADLLPIVRISETSQMEYGPTFETYGSISYTTKADVYPMFTELIRDLCFEEGDRVAEGDILVRLSRQKLEIQLGEAGAEVRIRESRLNLARQQRDEGQRNMEARFYDIETARLDLKQAEADWERIERILENKQKLFQMEGISAEEMASVELESFEKELALERSRKNLAVKMIGFRDEDLLKAGYKLPEGEVEKKQLLTEYNTRMLQAEVDVAQAELEASLSQQETLDLYLSETSITAPISGLIGRKYMEEGEKASPEKPLYMIFPDKEVYALAEVSEKDLIRLQTGQMVIVSTDHSEESRQGTLQRITPWVRQDSRTATIKIFLDNRDSFFRVGQFVRIRVELSEAEPTVMIPREALLYEEEESYVFTLRGNRLFRRDLQCGEAAGSLVPVLQGLSSGERVVLDPRESYRDGMEVKLP